MPERNLEQLVKALYQNFETSNVARVKADLLASQARIKSLHAQKKSLPQKIEGLRNELKQE